MAARGYSRDGKKGKTADRVRAAHRLQGRPVAVRVFPGNTGDPGAFTAIAEVVRKKFGLIQMIMAGDRGMIASARIDALNQAEDATQQPGTSSRNPAGALRDHLGEKPHCFTRAARVIYASAVTT